MKKEKVRKTFLWSDLLIVATIIIGGGALLPLGGSMATLGVSIILVGIAMLPFMRHGYKISGYRGTYRLEELLMPRAYQETLLNFLQSEVTTLELQPGKTGGALIKIYQKRGDQTILSQYFDYDLHLEGTDFPIVQIKPDQLNELRRVQTIVALF